MKKLKHTIRIENIHEGQLKDTGSHVWLDNYGNEIPWVSGSLDFSPETGSVFFNVTGSLEKGYYEYDGDKWLFLTSSDINNKNFKDYQLPIFLDSSVDELGPMVGFNGSISNEVKSVSANFAYDLDCRTISITNNTDYQSFKNRDDLQFTIFWGDGTSENIDIFETKTKTYTGTTTEQNILIIASGSFGTFQTVKTVNCDCDPCLFTGSVVVTSAPVSNPETCLYTGSAIYVPPLTP